MMIAGLNEPKNRQGRYLVASGTRKPRVTVIAGDLL